MNVGASVIDTDHDRFTCLRVKNEEPRAKRQGRMRRSSSVPIKPLSICGGGAMKGITVAIIGGYGALLVDCLYWGE